ncbi:MAG: RsmB/NOP family class I SAM-dependent RNA methyltransferase [Candidatus Omnitrophica bacterium]|nr:RsmB/NOP family class I SAM-dependent RNA methyltransferase [Candidatus Omnitrophota bacterium]
MSTPLRAEGSDPVSSRRQHARLCHAASLWEEIRIASAPADRWLGNYFFRNRKKLGSQDRRFLSQTIYSLFRHRSYIAAWADFLGGPHDALLWASLGALLDGQITGAQWAEASPLNEKQTAFVSKKCASFLAFKFPVLEPASGSPALALRFSFPEWMVARWLRDFGSGRVRPLLEIYEKRPPLTVRVNPVKISRHDLMQKFKKAGFSVRTCGLTPWAIVFEERAAVFDLEEFKQGLFEVQDAGSQKVCEVLGLKPGQLVWDACAGGGGKSLLMGAILENKGRIVATDIRPQKLQDLKKRAKRAGLFNVFPADLNRMDEIRSARQGFDCILVDAPCSGTGTLRRNPDAKWKLTEDLFLRQQSEQVKILEGVLPRLRKGGRVFYVTCSLEKEENEAVIEKVFSNRKDFRLIPLSGFGTVSAWGSRLWPSDENDGFFAAAAEKIEATTDMETSSI